jgi:hypothetical protein
MATHHQPVPAFIHVKRSVGKQKRVGKREGGARAGPSPGAGVKAMGIGAGESGGVETATGRESRGLFSAEAATVSGASGRFAAEKATGTESTGSFASEKGIGTVAGGCFPSEMATGTRAGGFNGCIWRGLRRGQ